MSNDEQKQLIQRFIDKIWNQQNLDQLNEFCADSYVEHMPFGDLEGVDELRGMVSMTQRAFPDINSRVDNVISEGNFVACNYVVEGTHEEEYIGIEATGNHMSVNGCLMCRIENGKLVEAWNQFDVMSLLMGMEVLPKDMAGAVSGGMGAGMQSGRRQ